MILLMPFRVQISQKTMPIQNATVTFERAQVWPRRASEPMSPIFSFVPIYPWWSRPGHRRRVLLLLLPRFICHLFYAEFITMIDSRRLGPTSLYHTIPRSDFCIAKFVRPFFFFALLATWHQRIRSHRSGKGTRSNYFVYTGCHLFSSSILRSALARGTRHSINRV